MIYIYYIYMATWPWVTNCIYCSADLCATDVDVLQWKMKACLVECTAVVWTPCRLAIIDLHSKLSLESQRRKIQPSAMNMHLDKSTWPRVYTTPYKAACYLMPRSMSLIVIPHRLHSHTIDYTMCKLSALHDSLCCPSWHGCGWLTV